MPFETQEHRSAAKRSIPPKSPKQEHASGSFFAPKTDMRPLGKPGQENSRHVTENSIRLVYPSERRPTWSSGKQRKQSFKEKQDGQQIHGNSGVGFRVDRRHSMVVPLSRDDLDHETQNQTGHEPGIKPGAVNALGFFHGFASDRRCPDRGQSHHPGLVIDIGSRALSSSASERAFCSLATSRTVFPAANASFAMAAALS